MPEILSGWVDLSIVFKIGILFLKAPMILMYNQDSKSLQ